MPDSRFYSGHKQNHFAGRVCELIPVFREDTSPGLQTDPAGVAGNPAMVENDIIMQCQAQHGGTGLREGV